MELQRVCQDIVGETEGVLACALVDLDTGLMLADERRAGVELEVEWLARSAGVMFRGGLMSQFASALSPRRSLSEYMREVQITTADGRQFLSVLPGRANTVLVLVTERAMSIGLGWMAVRQSEGRFGDPGGTGLRGSGSAAEAARATRVRGGQTPEPSVPSAPPEPQPRTEPRVAPVTASEAVRPSAGRMVTGLPDRHPVASPEADSESPKAPEEARKPTRVGARAFFGQKT